jgi:hypothetical protein
MWAAAEVKGTCSHTAMRWASCEGEDCNQGWTEEGTHASVMAWMCGEKALSTQPSRTEAVLRLLLKGTFPLRGLEAGARYVGVG